MAIRTSQAKPWCVGLPAEASAKAIPARKPKLRVRKLPRKHSLKSVRKPITRRIVKYGMFHLFICRGYLLYQLVATLVLYGSLVVFPYFPASSQLLTLIKHGLPENPRFSSMIFPAIHLHLEGFSPLPCLTQEGNLLIIMYQPLLTSINDNYYGCYY